MMSTLARNNNPMYRTISNNLRLFMFIRMKRIFYLLICLMAAIPLAAKNGINLKSGDASVFGKSVKAFVEFDYSKAEIEGKDMSLEDYIDQKGYKFEQKWERAREMSHKDFIKQFNKKSLGMKLSADSTGAEKYKMIIQIRTINLGNTAKSLLPIGARTDGGASLFGRIVIKDVSGSNICTLSFSDIQGNGTSTVEVRMMYAYQALRSAILSYIKKSSAKKVKAEEDEEDEEDDEEED